MIASTTKIIANLILFTFCMQICCGSAIPIWEFLSRNEKMSHLYSTFAQLVSNHCKMNAAMETLDMPVNQCKRNLLNYGYEKLQTLSDSELDTFDPYQREANELIWASIMRNHPNVRLITTTKPMPTVPVTSLIILTQSKTTTNDDENNNNNMKKTNQSLTLSSTSSKTLTTTTTTTTTTSSYPINPIFNSDSENKHNYAMDMDIAYGYSLPSDSIQVETFIPPLSSEQSSYLSGPLVVRVLPDGTPVEEDKHKPLPRDDDLESFQFTKKNNVQSDVIKSKNQHIITFTLQARMPPVLPLFSQELNQQQQQSSALLQRSRRQFKIINKSIGDNFLLPIQSNNRYQQRI